MSQFFEHVLTRWTFLIGFCLLLTRAFFAPTQSDYFYSRTETVEVVALRPLEGAFGTHRVLVSFKLEDGRVDTLTLSNAENLKTGHQIEIDVLERSSKKNRVTALPKTPLPLNART